MSLIPALERFFPPPIRQRGDRYFDEGRVKSARFDGQKLRANVKGSSAKVYRVVLGLTDTATLGVSCECIWYEDGNPCKHIWAVIRRADDAGAAISSVPVIRLSLHEFEDEIEEEEESEEHPPLPPPSPIRPRERATPWRSVLSAIPRRPGRVSHRFDAPAEVLYAVEHYGSRLNPYGISLVVLGRFRKKNGEIGRPRELRFDPDDLGKLPAADQEILRILNLQSHSASSFEPKYSLRPMAASQVLVPICRSGRLHVRHVPDPELTKLEWDEGAPWRLRAAVTSEPGGNGWRLGVTLERDGTVIPPSEATFVLPDLVLLGSKLAPLEDPAHHLPWLQAISDPKGVTIPEADRDAFIAHLAATGLDLELPEQLRWVVEDLAPGPILHLVRSPHSSEMHAAVSFRYGTREIGSDTTASQWMEGSRLVRRQFTSEHHHMATIESLPLIHDYQGGYRIRQNVLAEVIGRLVAKGWEIEIDGQALRTADSFVTSIESGIDWFDVRGAATFGTTSVAMPDLIAAFEAKQSIIRLDDGSFGILPEEWIARLSLPLSLGKTEGDAIRFRKSQALLIDALLGARGEVTADEAFERLRRIRNTVPKPLQESRTFGGELRPYQRDGLGWMELIRGAGLGGCLADDMGLGKTVQVLALLDRIPREERAPTLVVVPRSLLYNWRRESERFTPHFRVLEYHGSGRRIEPDEIGSYDLVLTTYGTLRRDVVELSGIEFGWVILDEAQAIKNSGSQVAKASRLLRGRNRLALSGTPIENHLGELWSLFEFLNPGMLGSARGFQSRFAAKTAPPENRELLAKALRPFILRRTKDQVAPELPSRTEQTLACDLPQSQREEYDRLRDWYRAALMKSIRENGLAKSKMHVLEALLRLRQIASHPGLVSGDAEAPSGKLDLLMEELAEVLEGGHKAIVFSQFTSLLAFVRTRLDQQKIEFAYLDGSTRDREAVVDDFQSPAGPRVFLVSLKAGGVGLNLTAADYVFLLDPWWNPAVEAQAIDRAHRIGQTRPVIAYRLIAKDTVEERIVELQDRKRALVDSIVSDENALLRKLELEDLEALLS